jgi:nicotinate-nucleotide adenylyltransferase
MNRASFARGDDGGEHEKAHRDLRRLLQPAASRAPRHLRVAPRPCFIHALGKELAPFEHRLAMCRFAFAQLSVPVRVLDLERTLGGESRTLRTVETLQAQHPQYQFSLVTGADIDAEASRWHHFDRIRELVDIIRVPRGPTSPIPDVSSTEIRRRAAAGLSLKNLVDTSVAVYIATKGLYRAVRP